MAVVMINMMTIKNKGKGNKLFQTFKDCKHDLFHLGPKKM